MKLKTALIGIAILCGLLPAVQATAEEKPAQESVLKTQRDRVNYAIGVNLIGNFKQQGIDIDLDKLIMGMKDAHAGGKLLLNDEEIRIAIHQYQLAVRQKWSPIKAKAAAAALKQGTDFLAANKAKPGVQVLPSGLQYKILKAGEGKTPTDADTVEIKVRGTFVNGHEIKGPIPTGNTMSIKVGDAIPGWNEALKLMPSGSVWEVFVPSQLAYGTQGKAPQIGPNETLIYEIELLGIK